MKLEKFLFFVFFDEDEILNFFLSAPLIKYVYGGELKIYFSIIRKKIIRMPNTNDFILKSRKDTFFIP